MEDWKTYDEITNEPIENPDLEKGHVYEGEIVTGYTEPETRVMKGSDNLREYIPSKPITEKCWLYHTYTDDELASMGGVGGFATTEYVDNKVKEAVTQMISIM